MAIPAGYPRCVSVGNDYGKTRLYTPIRSKTTAVLRCARHHSAQRGRPSPLHRFNLLEKGAIEIVPPAQSESSVYCRYLLHPDEKVVQDERERKKNCLFVTYTIIHSITSSEMCSLHLTHPSAHTRGAVGSQRCSAQGAVWVWCLAQGSHLSRGQILPEPRFEPTTSGYKSIHAIHALSIRATTAPQGSHFETDPLVNMPRGLVHVAGSERRVLSHPGSPPSQTILEIRFRRGGISIQGPTVWAVPGSPHFYTMHGCGSLASATYGNPHTQLPRQLAHSGPVAGGFDIAQDSTPQPLRLPGAQGQLCQEHTVTQPVSFVPGHSYRLSADDSNCLSGARHVNSAP